MEERLTSWQRPKVLVSQVDPMAPTLFQRESQWIRLLGVTDSTNLRLSSVPLSPPS